MAVITQNPVLFTASLRMNLDPFEEHRDKEHWDAFREVYLVAKGKDELSNKLKENDTELRYAISDQGV